MSFNSSNSSPRQRKLSDLRVIDLQRELRSFGIVFDKKELKVSLLEKLRQALIHRDLDPDLYLFDESKTIVADETTQNREESSFQDANFVNSSCSEIQSETLMNVENPVQTVAKSPTTDCTNGSPSRLIIDDESCDPVDQLDTNNIARQWTERIETDAIFLDKNQLSHHKEDENNNEKMDQNVDQQQSYAITDRDLHNEMSDETKADIDQQNSTKELTSNIDNDQATVLDTDSTAFQPHATSIEEKTNDDVNLSKSTEENQNASSQNEQNTKATNSKSHKDQCHLWVSNIAKETHASHLKELFSKHGKVLTTKVIGSTSAQWFGYITLASSDDVEKCIHALHQTELHGKKIYVDWEMHDSKSYSNVKTSQSSTSKVQEPKSDQHSSSQEKSRQPESRDKNLPRKRKTSSSTESKKKISKSDVNFKNKDDRARRSHETDSSNKRRRESSNTSHSSTNKMNRSANKPNLKDSRDDRLSQRSRSPRRNSNDASKIKAISSISHRSRSKEKPSGSSSTSLSRHRSSSIEKFKTQPSSSTKYDRTKESSSKDHPRSGSSGSFDSNRRSRHEKDPHDRKYDSKIFQEEMKERRRRLDEERKHLERELELLERERMEIEFTRLELEKEKQDQAREIEKQKRLADEAKHRQQQIEAKARDEKLQRLAHGDNKRSRVPHHETQRRHQPNLPENSKNGNNSNREFDYRSSVNSIDARDRHRPAKDLDRSYFPDNKKSFTSSNDHPRDAIFRDRLPHRDGNLVISTQSLNNDPSLPLGSSIHNQRYSASSSNQHRLPDPYVNLPPRGRDMAIPSGPPVASTYERPTRTVNSSSNTSDVINRRPYGRDTFDSRDYHHDIERHDRSPATSNKLCREPIDTNHWDRPKPRDSTHYASDAHKYMTNQYVSESSSQSVQQAGLWSSAPPSRQTPHHSDPSAKPDSYTWQQPLQPTPSQTTASHHSQNMASTHDRSRSNLSNHQRLQMLQSNQTGASTSSASAPSGSRSNVANQSHLYNHPGIGVSALPGSQQQHVPLVPPPTSLHHTTTYLTQTVPPTGLVLHSSGQTRTYEPHYVVTQALPPQRRY